MLVVHLEERLAVRESPCEPLDSGIRVRKARSQHQVVEGQALAVAQAHGAVGVHAGVHHLPNTCKRARLKVGTLHGCAAGGAQYTCAGAATNMCFGPGLKNNMRDVIKIRGYNTMRAAPEWTHFISLFHPQARLLARCTKLSNECMKPKLALKRCGGFSLLKPYARLYIAEHATDAAAGVGRCLPGMLE